MMSKVMQHIYDTVVLPREKTLNAYDFHLNGCVDVWHQDGTTYHFTNAFSELYTYNEQDYLAVYTEHNGYHLFSISDLAENRHGGYRDYIINTQEPIRSGVV